MNKYVFKSVFANYMLSYLKEHADRGYKNEQHHTTLSGFDRFAFSQKCTEIRIDNALYDKWFEEQCTLSYTTIYQRASHMRSFMIYLTKQGMPCMVPRLPKYKRSDYVPYIFSHDEITLLFETCDKCVEKQHMCKSIIIIMPALLRLLYSTGIRIGEALSIRNRDIDFERHIINLYATKNGHERIAPINESLEAVLRQYICYRDRLPVQNVSTPGSYLFTSMQGKQVTQETVLRRFHDITEAAGIIDTYNGKNPRIHDLRHTACVHSMQNMLEKGKDLYCHLPILATFMGHVKITDTEYYLRLVQAQHPELIQQQVSVTESITGIVNRALIIKEDGDV